MTNSQKAAIHHLLISTDRGGMATEDLADKLNLTNRQVGRVMAELTKEGLVRRYPRGYVTFTNLLSGKPEPCYFNNSYYEWIGQ